MGITEADRKVCAVPDPTGERDGNRATVGMIGCDIVGTKSKRREKGESVGGGVNKTKLTF